jgi:hypothetical protein
MEIDGQLKLPQFLFYKWPQDLDAFLLIWIVGGKTVQVPDRLADTLNGRSVRFEVALLAREEIASLSCFRINEPGRSRVDIP